MGKLHYKKFISARDREGKKTEMRMEKIEARQEISCSALSLTLNIKRTAMKTVKYSRQVCYVPSLSTMTYPRSVFSFKLGTFLSLTGS
jgi:hypothetical protein